jgi:undecaprenyl-diphosphatase
LRLPWVYAAGLLSLLVFAPVLVWNAQHDWFSFRFQLGKAGGSTEAFPGKHLLEFTTGYVLLFSPVLALGGVLPLVRRLRTAGRQDHPVTLLAVMGLVPIGFFSLAMIRGSFPDPKWANVGFISFFLVLGHDLDRWWGADRRARVWLALAPALALNAGVLALLAFHAWRPFLPMPEGNDPTRQVVGWAETGRLVTALLARQNMPPPAYVISFTYPLASQFALHLPSRPYTFSLKRPQRNLWSDRRLMTPANTILVCQQRECNWVHRLMIRQFGWTLETIGTVETTQWGAMRQSVTVMRAAALPAAPAPEPRR